MMNRRKFVTQSSLAAAGVFTAATVPAFGNSYNQLVKIEKQEQNQRYRPISVAGMGGVATGNGFHENPDTDVNAALEAAWNSGVRYYDTSPWYGLGLNECRFGHFLRNQKREEFTLSTKVGRVLTADKDFVLNKGLWKGKLNFSYRYDYSAAGVRRSIEDSLQRLGLPYLDIVYIHDISPDNEGMKENWVKYFNEALKGAMPELNKMRKEGIIKAWGLR